MKNSVYIDLFKSFEKKLDSFIKNPKKYKFKIENRLFRQYYNASQSFFIWLFISIMLNIIGLYFFIKTENNVSLASLLAMISLLFTIGSRNYTINYILFDTIGNLGKCHILHELANRIGFFHRFMAISTFIWFSIHIYYSSNSNKIAFLLLLFLFIIIVSAFAFFRRKFHNIFETIHRYLGYISIMFLIYYYMQVSFYSGLNIQETILNVKFLVLSLIVILLISPWIGIKKISPELTHIGPHVIGIKIDGKPSFGTYSKITLGNYCYHPFGDSMLNFNDMNSRTLYMTPAGDKTSDIVYSANKGEFKLPSCHIKKNRNRGFMYHHAIFDKILIVVTGGGIAPIIPCLVLNKKTKIDVLWIGRSQSEEFTDEVLESLMNKVSDQEIGIHILDTTQEDLKNFTNENYAALAIEAYEHYKPEAVFIMSNQNFTIDLIYTFKEKNIKVYGATFDS